MSNTQTVQNEVNEVAIAIEALDSKATLKDVITKLNEIIEFTKNVKASGRNRGPQSTREMTLEDAERIMLGDLKDKSHKVAAETLGLSYGQVYSARGGYTFKTVYKQANTK